MKTKIDWLISYTMNGEACACCGKKEYDFLPCFFNATTQGLGKYGHQEFQMVLRIENKMVLYILNSLGIRVQKGECFNDGDAVSDILEVFDIRLKAFEENGETILRVLLPDPQGRFPDDPNCDCAYAMQGLPLKELMIQNETPTVRLYQIVPGDKNRDIIYESFEEIKSVRENRIPEEEYECVYEGKMNVKFPDEAFDIFNNRHPIGYKGRSMSTSDVIEFTYSATQDIFYFCNPHGWVMIKFDKNKTRKSIGTRV